MYVPEHLEIIETKEKGRGVIAKRFIKKGESIYELSFDCFQTNEFASDFAVQMWTDVFTDRKKRTIDDFFNHSCNPHAKIRLNIHYDYQALRDINPGNEVTWNYLTTEYDLTKDNLDFDCKCNSDDCFKRIKGFKFLTREQRIELWPLLTPFLRLIVNSDKPPFSSDLFKKN